MTLWYEDIELHCYHNYVAEKWEYAITITEYRIWTYITPI